MTARIDLPAIRRRCEAAASSIAEADAVSALGTAAEWIAAVLPVLDEMADEACYGHPRCDRCADYENCRSCTARALRAQVKG